MKRVPEIVSLSPKTGVVHVRFGETSRAAVTYCGMDYHFTWDVSGKRHCKNCTKELRKAGMSWHFFENRKQYENNH